MGKPNLSRSEFNAQWQDEIDAVTAEDTLYRFMYIPIDWYFYVGFRCAQDLEVLTKTEREIAPPLLPSNISAK